ncbi:phage terminase large subunit-like protein [Pseudaminobacter salicylatoxidans]|uniref:Phage terminase large subunit-like protein n=1 Tax=Pseudaminobacter salicylatoxidans TaxID=93369 RepID=A0A316C7X3_PSESE|nr:terminase family protein [Pseudaminobacter salicylatoxidans]PWJ85333.1 phage terminase large subunit-like protein [Pseudaminobacter salicylatoxidans]
MQGNWSEESLRDENIWLIEDEWLLQARIEQYLLTAQPGTWLVIGGRGAGKTRLGAEWVNSLVRGFSPFALGRHGHIALVGETLGDVREVMIEGQSGIVTISRHDRPRFEASRRRLVWDNGAIAQIFSSEDPESLRGPQFEAAWCDELGKWKNDEACFDMLQFGLRLGQMPRQLITTTPRPTKLLKRLMADPTVLQTRMRTADNAGNLAEGFLHMVEQRYGGTRLGRQELEGELIEDREDALWSRAALENARLDGLPQLQRIVVAIDPPASSHKASDACGIVAAGLDESGAVIMLADASMKAARPQDWAGAAVALYHALGADCLVAEVNQGGDMVTAVIRAVDAAVPVKAVRARRGKWLRAEPVAMLYQQGRVRHAGRFPELEDEMCDFGPNGLSNGRSPDRLDALVWAVNELMPDRSASPRIREFL